MDDFKPQQQTPPQRPDDTEGLRNSPDNEPETYVTPEGRPTTLDKVHIEPALPVAAPAKKSGAKKWLVWGAVALLLAALSALAYWQWAEAQNAKQELNSTQNQLETAQADLAKVGEGEDEKDDASTTDQPAVTDTELIKTETEAYLAAADKNSYVYVADNVKTEGDFAVVKASMPNTGANPKVVVLEKSKDNWVVIYSVVGPVPATEKDRLTTDFGVPKTLLAE